MKKDIVIVGSGGFAREAAWLLQRINKENKYWNFWGYIDNYVGKQVIGDDKFLLKHAKELAVVLAIGNPQIRRKLYREYKQNRHLYFPNLIDPSAQMSESVMLGEGNIICANSVLTIDIQMGDCNIINLDCTVGHDVLIGSFCTLNPGTNVSGSTRIKDGCSIGTGVQIIQGVTIGEGVVIGAGAVVIKDIRDGVLAVGVPAIEK